MCGILDEAGRAGDCIELGLGAGAGSGTRSETTSSTLLTRLHHRQPHQPTLRSRSGSKPYVNLVRWIIELHRMTPGRWVTLRDVYRCTLDPKRIERQIAEVEARVEPPGTVRVRMADLAPHADGTELAAWSWTPVGDGALRTANDAALRKQLTKLAIPFDVESAAPSDPARRERLDAVPRWYAQDWLRLDLKLRSSIIEGLSVFLSVFDLPDVAAVFCPPRRPKDAPADSTAGVDTAAVARQLPLLDEVIDVGKVFCLNMPAGTSPALSRAVGVMLKQAWLQTLLRRPADGAPARPGVAAGPVPLRRVPELRQRGRGRPGGRREDVRARQSRLIPIVATQSISSLRAVLARAVGGVAGAAPDAPHAHLPVAGRRLVVADREHVVRPGLDDEGQLHRVGADGAGRRLAALRVGRRAGSAASARARRSASAASLFPSPRGRGILVEAECHGSIRARRVPAGRQVLPASHDIHLRARAAACKRLSPRADRSLPRGGRLGGVRQPLHDHELRGGTVAERGPIFCLIACLLSRRAPT